MSKQLAISAAFSVFAMSAFVLLGTPDAGGVSGFDAPVGYEMGAEAIASTPILDRLVPDLIR